MIPVGDDPTVPIGIVPHVMNMSDLRCMTLFLANVGKQANSYFQSPFIFITGVSPYRFTH